MMISKHIDSPVLLIDSGLLIVLIVGALMFTSCNHNDEQEIPIPVSENSSCPDANHPHMIDLGLPSRTKWACCNLGAESPEQSGGYYAWGENYVKEIYVQGNYTHIDSVTRNYINIGLDIASTEYDAATANWGAQWHMPSSAQCQELIDNCTLEWVTENTADGRKFTGPNGKSIFLPASGWREDMLYSSQKRGGYWSSNCSMSEPMQAEGLYFSNKFVVVDRNGRSYGNTVRPVCND